jgi:hypothetical protein
MEALVGDLRSGLQTLRGEKAMVDLALEKAGELSFEVKEAEALIRALRDERKASTRFLEAMRLEGDTDRPEQRAG